MRPSAIAKLTLSVSLLCLAGCSEDPSEGVHDAGSEDAVDVPTVDGEKLALSAESTLGFTGSKVTGKHDGVFKEFTGSITLVEGDPTRSQIEVVIEMDSVETDSQKLDGHLKSDDFFGVETYPTAKFVSTAIEKKEDGYHVTGNLSLHGVTKSIQFPAAIEVTEKMVTARAEFKIDRKDFEIAYAGKPDDLIRDGVVIRFDVKAER